MHNNFQSTNFDKGAMNIHFGRDNLYIKLC